MHPSLIATCRRSPLALAAWITLATLAAAPGARGLEDLDEASEVSREAPAPTDPEAGDPPGAPQIPVATQEATLHVADSLPYVPTSNTIATKLPVALAWTPANVGVVGAPLLLEQGALILGDALKNVSGLNVQTGQGVFDFFVVRGFDSVSSGLVLTDGAPEPEASFYQLYNAERVEVLKGPGGFLYGPNPLSGAVNIVRKQPVPGSFLDLGLSAGSFGTYEGTLDVNATSGQGAVAYRLNGLWRESDGYRDGISSSVTAVNPSLTWRPGPKSSLNLNLEVARSDYQPDAGLPLVGGELPDVPRRRTYYSPFDFSEQDILRFQADYETELSPALTLRNKTYLRDLDWATDGTLLAGAFPNGFGGFAVARSLLLLKDDQSFVGNQLEVVYRGRTGAVTHDLLAGVELSLLRDEFTLDVGQLPFIDLVDPVETAVEAPPAFPLQAGDSEAAVVAPYVIDQMRLSERLQLLLGARYDAIDFDDQVTGTSRSDGELSPMLGLVFAPRPDLSFYANGSRAFAPPSPRVVGDREPEASRQVELGVRKEALGGRLRATLAVYQIERDNIAIPDDNGFTQQTGDQRARGVELELAAQPAPGLTTLFVYAYTDSELTEFRELVPIDAQGSFVVLDRSGNTSAFAPKHLANLWVSKRLGGGFSLGGGARYVGDQFIAEDNLAEIGGYLLLDASLSYSFESWGLTLHLRNLTDQDYETRAFGSASVIPGEPLAAYVGVHYRR